MFDILSERDDLAAGSISKLRKYIEDEEFETDSIKLDVSTHFNGNIIRNIADKEISRELCNFVLRDKCMRYIVTCFCCSSPTENLSTNCSHPYCRL